MSEFPKHLFSNIIQWIFRDDFNIFYHESVNQQWFRTTTKFCPCVNKKSCLRNRLQNRLKKRLMSLNTYSELKNLQRKGIINCYVSSDNIQHTSNKCSHRMYFRLEKLGEGCFTYRIHRARFAYDMKRYTVPI